MRKVYEIATGKEFVMIHDIDAREAVLTGYYAYELPIVVTEEKHEPVTIKKKQKAISESSYPDSPLSE